MDGMSPMEEFAWFQSPKLSYIQAVSGARVQLCTVNTYRVGLILANPSPVSVVVAPDPQIPLSADQGINLYGYNEAVYLTQHDYGNLVQWEWWMAFVGSPAPTILVTEILLRDWPCPSVATGTTLGTAAPLAMPVSGVTMHPMGAVGAAAGLGGLTGLSGYGGTTPGGHLLFDTFTDTTGTALTAHTMEIGPGWTIDSGTWTIQSNTAQNSDSDAAGGAFRIVQANSTASDIHGVLHFVAATSQLACYLLFRMADGSNWWGAGTNSLGGANTFYLSEMTAGVETVRANDSPVLVSGHTYDIDVVAKGTSLTAKLFEYVAGVPTLRSTVTFTSSSKQTNTICGQGEFRNTTGAQYTAPNQFDTFTVDAA